MARAKMPPAPERLAGEFDLRDPADFKRVAYASEPSTRITDEGARVLDWARRVATADLDPTDRAYLELSREQLAQAVATLGTPGVTAKARQTATGRAIIAAFQVGEIKGRISTALWGREAWPRSHTLEATKKRVAANALAAETRRDRLRAIYTENDWPLDKPRYASREPPERV
jgi:hypothetical protein